MAIMKYETKIKLYNSYFDMNDKISAKAVLNIFQDVASSHAEGIGVGFEKMLKKNLYWVLSRIKFDIIKQPNVNQVVIVETWPHEKGRIDFDRDMRISSEDGEILIKATSKWCLIDTKTRTLQRTEGVDYEGEVYPQINYDDKFAKIRFDESNLEKVYDYQVRFCDLDHNKHMNNTNYATLVLNAVKVPNFSHFEINFNSECLLDDTIAVMNTTSNEGEVVVGKNGERIAFVAHIR